MNAPAPAVYELIDGGVADGVFFPFETMHAFKIAELAKFSFHNPDGMYTTVFGLIMNDDTYNDLDATQKACGDDMKGVNLARTIVWFWDIKISRLLIIRSILIGVTISIIYPRFFNRT